MRRFRFVTYNIHKAQGLDRRTSIERIARVIEELDADIVALQEVVNRDGPGGDQVRFLSERLGYWPALGEARKHDGAPYGNVTLSRRRIIDSRQHDLTVHGHEERCALRTDIRVGASLLHVFNLHLGTNFFERRKQAARLIEDDVLRAIDIAGPRIVAGDFNEWTRGLVSRNLTAEFHDLTRHLKRRRVYPAGFPLLHLDHAYYDSHLAVEQAYFHINRRSLIASDHLPLVVDFQFTRP
ncbi:MAG: endonuclease/exonuclease/phosphatase family protein [Bryobacteraceae bacterium]